MNALTIQVALRRKLVGTAVCIAPNYTPANWWECDLWAVSRAGYVTEFEIKLSRKDFLADSRKSALRRLNGKFTMANKHELLAGHDVNGPSRFYYVTPEGLDVEVPEWAGLVVAIQYEQYPNVAYLHTKKAAPQLHKKKATRREIQLAHRRMWHRYWDCLETLSANRGAAQTT